MTKRIDEIRNLIYERKKVNVNELCDYYNVSAVSIRKDLSKLEQEGVLSRTYGGAVLSKDIVSFDSSPAIYFDNPILSQLAEHAFQQIEDNDIIFLGSGRTCCILAKLLHKIKNLSVVTNNVTALDDLLESGARIYLLGGEVTSTDGKTLFSSPEDPISIIDIIRVNKAFTSISGIDLQKGLTVNSIISTYIYRYVPSISNSWYIMASSDKFNKLAMYTAASFDDVDCIITDSFPPEYQSIFDNNSIEVITTN